MNNRHEAGLRPSQSVSLKPRTLRAADQEWSYAHYPALDSFQFSWSLFNHSQLDALSAACPSAFTATLCYFPHYPGMPIELNAVHTDCAKGDNFNDE